LAAAGTATDSCLVFLLHERRFPAYFNFFIRQKKVILVVDSDEAETNIRSVFGETLLGPPRFRDEANPLAFSEEDFDPSFPVERRPDFFKELKHFRAIGEDLELSTDLLIEFRHFVGNQETGRQQQAVVGVPPEIPEMVDRSDSTQGLNSSWSDLPMPPQTSMRSTATEGFAHHTDSIFNSRRLSRGVTTDAVSDSFVSSRRESRRESGASVASNASLLTLSSRTFLDDVEKAASSWSYSRVKWLGEVATVWPIDASPEDIKTRRVPRVEIFRMPGGSEYYIHDVDENNIIVGKLRFSGTVRIPDKIAVEGFSPGLDCVPSAIGGEISSPLPTPTFHPPSFGVTVLGNSHGFDMKGSTSGYVIWVNGRGIMVDPPPYSSATLEKEGIRPQLIIGLIITHCHADHDAGAFQKLLTGSRVSVITAPCIYKSFIRKYAALSGLKPNILKHSHRFRPAIVGKPLYFQGGTFEFNFSLHSIPCISFKVSWRGRSIVFTGDHLNSPPVLEKIRDKGILSGGRYEELANLPLQPCSVLLHEAGTPPLHTPLKVLQELPDEVKARLYVVHTSDMPEDCGLRIAPTGTAGTIRLDQTQPSLANGSAGRTAQPSYRMDTFSSGVERLLFGIDPASLEDGADKNLTLHGDHVAPLYGGQMESPVSGVPPLVFLRPTDVSDAWFILNLLSNVPFFSGLSYMNTMEVLEIATVKIFCSGDVVVPADRREDVLCVVWEGTCSEKTSQPASEQERALRVWHAGDWAGPVSMTPDTDNCDSLGRDIVALSEEGVKTIMLLMNDLETILHRGSKQYRKYLTLQQRYAKEATDDNPSLCNTEELSRNGNVLDAFRFNSLFNSLSPLQKRSLEPIPEGPRVFDSGAFLWKVGERCDYGYLLVSGSVSFGSIHHVQKSSAAGFHGSQRRSSRTAGQIELDNGDIVDYDKVIQDVSGNSEFARLESLLTARAYDEFDDRMSAAKGQRLAQDRFVNRMLGRLYAARRYTSSLIFTRGSFVCDTSRMVSGELLEKEDGESSSAGAALHTSNLVVGQEGCIAFVFPKATFAPFLDANPGILLSLQGTQAVV
jgi:glyoxylase-like metal-dependent hydrolase (beta-lactamase superfamily II)